MPGLRLTKNSGMADKAEVMKGNSFNLEAANIAQDDVASVYEAAPIQKAMFLMAAEEDAMQQTLAHSPHPWLYSDSYWFHLPAHLNVALFVQAWDKLVEQFAILRTSFLQLSKEGQAATIAAIEWKHGRGPFKPISITAKDAFLPGRQAGMPHLSTGQICASAVLILATDGKDDRPVLRLDLHHALMDGTSLAAMMTKLVELYHNQQSSSRSLTLNSATPARVAQELRHLNTSADRQFWASYLSNIQAVQWPVRHGAGASNGLYCTDRFVTASCRRGDAFPHDKTETSSTIIRTALAAAMAIHAFDPTVAEDLEGDIVFFEVASLRGRLSQGEARTAAAGPVLGYRLIRARPTRAALLNDLQSQLDTKTFGRHEMADLGSLLGTYQGDDTLNFRRSCQVMLVCQSTTSMPELNPTLCEIAPVMKRSSHTSAPITVEVLPLCLDRNEVRVHFDTRHIVEADARAFANHIVTIIKMLTSSEQRQPLTMEETSRQLAESDGVAEWRSQPHSVAASMRELVETGQQTMHGGCEQNALRYPMKVALQYAEQSFITYGELNRRAARVAHNLHSRGVQPGAFVIVCMKRTDDTITTILGILKAGAAYVPVDPMDPPARKKLIFEETNAAGVVVIDKLEDDAEWVPHSAGLWTAKELQDETDDESSYLQTQVSPDSLAYLLFTSGSTGRPKAVAVEHRNVATWTKTNRSWNGLQWSSRILLINALVFDMSVAGISAALSLGACLCLPSPEALAIEWDVVSEELLVTEAFFTPTIIKAAFVDGNCPDSPWLQRLCIGGEAWPVSLAKKLGRHYDFTNQYGPTETCITVFGSPSPLFRNSNEKLPYLTVGQPFPAVRILIVLPGSMQPVPLGAIGELVIFGPQTTRGYFGRPDLTARAFGTDDVSGLRYFRSGDAARLRSDGQVEVRGRIDSQVKIRGYRIELGEIQTALQAVQGVQEAVVFVVTPPATEGAEAKGPYLTAALTFKDKQFNEEAAVLDEDLGLRKLGEAQFSSLQTHLESVLPQWMVPAAIFTVDKIPLMPSSGKADVRTIAARIGTLRGRADSKRNEIKSIMKKTVPTSTGTAAEDSFALCAGAWRQVLGLDKEAAGKLTGESNFFHEGGDSIKLMQLQRLLRKAGCDVSHATLRSQPRLAAQVATISVSRPTSLHNSTTNGKIAPKLAPTDHVSPQLPQQQDQRFTFFKARQQQRLKDYLDAQELLEKDIVDIYPLTPMQKSLVSSSLADPEGGWNWGTYDFELPANIDLERLSDAWRTTVAEADVLRTVFLDPSIHLDEDAEEVHQYQATLSMNSALASSLCDLERAAWPGEPVLQYGRPAVDLVVQGKTKLSLSAHHAVLDGWSFRMILERLSRAYNEISVPRSTTDSTPFSAIANAIASMSQEERKKSADFWQERMEDPPQVDWPRSQRPEDASRKPRTDSMLHEDIGFLPAPYQSGHAAETTLAAVVRTSIALTLAAHAGSSDVVLGEVNWGRSWLVKEVPGAVDTVGPCLTTLPVRLRDWQDQTWSQCTKSLQQTSTEASSLPPLASLKEAFPANVVCPIHVLVSMQTFTAGMEDASTGDELKLGDVWLDKMPIDFRVVVQATRLQDATWRLGLKYDSGFLNHGDARLFLSHIVAAVRFGLANPASLLKDTEGVTLASPQDCSRWLTSINRAPGKRSLPHPTFLERFHKTCQSYPQKIALQFSDREFLTYADLYARSSHLAAKLYQLLRPSKRETNTPVIGVLMAKSVGQIVSLLAILKAGAAYLPLDGSQPAARLRYLVETTQAPIVLLNGVSYLTKAEEAQLDKVALLFDVANLCASEEDKQLPCLTGQELVYTLFTSGSTGLPKAVQVGAHHLAAFITSALSTYALKLTSRRLGFSKLTFDMSVSDIFGTFSSGACLVIASEEELYENLQAQVEEGLITYLNLTPTVASLLDYTDLTLLQCVVLGGEPVSTHLLRTLTSLANVDVFNSMGPTETVVDILALRLGKEMQNEAFVPLGVPLRPGRSRVYLLDTEARLVPPGVPGEICIAGDQVSFGYLDNAKAQASFGVDPFFPDQRMYKSGDLGRLRCLQTADSSDFNYVIEHLGRKDNQIKLNGIRIDLSEVEAALRQHKSVANCAAIINKKQEDASRSPLGSLVAFVAFKEDEVATPPTKEEVLAQAATFLPSYAVPSWLQVLPSIPFTTSGKVDSKHLQAVIADLEAKMQQQDTIKQPEVAAIKPKDKAAADDDDTIRTRLANAWAKVLGRSAGQLRDSDAFYRIGGDSISAIRLAAESRRVQLPLKVVDIASHQTLAQQVSLLQDRLSHHKAEVAVSAQSNTEVTSSKAVARSSLDLDCLAPPQLFFLEQSAQRGFDSNHFNQSMTWEVGKDVRSEALAAAWSQILGKHPALHWRFLIKKGDKGIPSHWKAISSGNGTKLPAARMDEVVVESQWQLQQAIDTFSASLDISKGNVARAALISAPDSLVVDGAQEREGRRLLFITIHHLCVDLVSWRTIHAQLTRALEEKEGTTPAEEDAAPYSLWVDRCRSAPWELQPSSVYAHTWPMWRAASEVKVEMTAEEQTLNRTVLAREEVNKLIDYANDGYGLQLLDVLIAMATLSLARCTEGEEKQSLTIGLEGHGRSAISGQDLNIEDTVGWFTSISLLSIDVPADGNIPLLLGRIRSERLKAQRGLAPSLFNAARSDKSVVERLPLIVNYHGQFQEMDAKTGANSLRRLSLPNIRSADHGSSVPDDLFAQSSLEIWFSASGDLQVAMSLPRAKPQLHASMRHFADDLQSSCQQLLDLTGRSIPNGRTTLIAEDCEANFATCPSAQEVEQFVEGLAATGLPLGEVERCLACLPMQEGLLAESQMAMSTDAYLTYRSYAVPSEVSIDQLVKGYKILMERHEILRTVFIWRGLCGGISQVVLSPESAISKVFDGKVVIKQKKLADIDNAGSVDVQIRQWLQQQSLVSRATQEALPLHGFALFPTQSGPLRLVWFAHHALIDAWTINGLETEWDLLTSSMPQPVLRPSFSDFVKHNCALDTDLSLDFWRDNLRGATQTLFPATDAMVTKAAEQRRCRVEVEGRASTKALVSEHGILPSTVFYAAYALTLSKQLGQDDVTFGCVLSGRSSDFEGVEAVIGPLITAVPLRFDLDRLGGNKLDQTTLSFLAQVQQQVNGVVQHGHVGLRRLQKEGLLSPSSLRSMATYQSLHFGDDVRKRDFLVHLDASDGLTHPFDLTAMTLADGRLSIVVDFDPSIMLQEDVQVIVERLSYVADQLCDASHLIGHLNWHPPQHQSLLDEMANRKPLDGFLADLPLLHEPFFARAQQWPDKIAIQLQDHRFLTYRQLEQQVLEMSEGIKMAVMEATSNSTSTFYAIPLHFPRSVECVVAILAVLTCGFAYNPIEVEANDVRKRFIIAMSEAPLIIASDLDQHSLHQVSIDCNVTIFTPSSMLKGRRGESQRSFKHFQPLRRALPHDVAMTLFTGGTTGQPKAVEIEHEQAASFIEDALQLYPISWATHKLSFASYTFDMHLFDHFATLWCGGLLIIEDLTAMLTDLQGVCKAYDASYLDLTPSVAAFLIPEALPFLQSVALGGEAISTSLRDRFAINSGVTLINAFGPTEAPADTVSFAWSKEHSQLPFVPIGKPFGHTRCYVLDEKRQPVPVGIPGELWVGGPQVARGYKGRPELNERIFVPDDIEAGPPGRRLYRSGDICVLHGNGLLQHLGRVDQEVKLHGQKVDLNQIEDVVRGEKGVEDVAVEVVDLRADTNKIREPVKKLVAFITLQQKRLRTSTTAESGVELLDEEEQASFSAGPIMASIRAAVGKELPTAWHPAFWLPMLSLPHLVSGKVDRRQLRALVESDRFRMSSSNLHLGAGAADVAQTPPESASERALAQAWIAALQVPAQTVMRETSYYDLGGDSIDAIRVIVLLKKAGFTGATVADVLRYDILSQFADLLRREEEQDPIEEVEIQPFQLVLPGALEDYFTTSTIPRQAHQDLLPLTPSQLDLLAGSLRTEDGKGAMATLCFLLAPTVDQVALAAAWRHLVTDAPILRTVFVLTNAVESGVLQAVLQHDNVSAEFLPPLECSSSQEMQTLARQHTPGFALGEPLAHAQLVLNKSKATALVLHLHHALYDGFSLPILLEALEERYCAAVTGSTDQLLKPIPGMTAIVRHIQKGDASVRHAYWTKRMEEVVLPTTSLSDTSVGLADATSEARLIAREEKISAQAFLSAKKVTAATVARFAYAVALARATQSSSVTFAEVSSGRFGATEPALDVACGPLMATAATVVTLTSHDHSVDDHLQALQRQKMRDSEHEHVGLSTLNDILVEKRGEANASEKLRNLFTVQPASKQAEGAASSESSGLGLEQVSGTMTIDFETTFEVSISSDTVQVFLQHQAEAVSSMAAERFVDLFFAVLIDISNGGSPHRAISPQEEEIDVNQLTPPSAPSVSDMDRSITSLSSFESTESTDQDCKKAVSSPAIDLGAWQESPAVDAHASCIASQSDEVLACAFTSTVCAHQGDQTVDFALVHEEKIWQAPVTPLSRGHAREHLASVSSQLKTRDTALQPTMAVVRSSSDRTISLQEGLRQLQAQQINVQRLQLVLMHNRTKCSLFHLSSKMEGADATYLVNHLVDLIRLRFVKGGGGQNDDLFGSGGLPLSQEEITKLNRWGLLMGPRSATSLKKSEPSTFLEQFKTQVARYPSKVALDAIRADGRCFTYSGLDRQTDELALKLQSLLKHGASTPIVALRFPRGPDAILAILAVMKAQAAYLPIHVDQPQERIEKLLHKAKVDLFLCHSPYDMPQHCSVKVVTMAALKNCVAHKAAVTPQHQDQDGLAYILSTSGSTGTPKALVISHKSLAAYIDSALTAYPISWRTRRFAAANYAFDVSVSDLFCTLAAGATLCMTDDEGFVADLQDVIHSTMPTFLNLTPTMCELIDMATLEHLDCVVLGGEPLPRHVAHQCMIHAAHVFNAVGPSECCVENIAGRLDPASMTRPHVPIGRPLKNVSVAVLNERGQHAGVGVVGCIFIGGPQVGQGYLVDDADGDKAQAAFSSHHPLQGQLSSSLGKVFRSGDLGRWHWNGTLEHMGREDRQIKLRGLRIELEDIERVLLKYGPSGLRFSIDVHSISGDPQLTAFVTRATTTETAAAAAAASPPLETRRRRELQRSIWDACKTHLPAYMVPTAIFFLDESLPVTANGKMDRRKLASIIANASKKEIELAMPPTSSICEGETEDSSTFAQEIPKLDEDEEVGKVWKALLPLFDGNLDRSFTSLGGNSLAAIKAVAMFKSIGRQVKVVDLLKPIALRDVFKTVTSPSARATTNVARIETVHTDSKATYKNFSLAGRNWKEDVRAAGLHPSDIEDSYPCLPFQKSVWLAEFQGGALDDDVNSAGRTSYLAPFVYEVPRHFQPSTLRLAWTRVVEARSILRTAFVPTTNPQQPLVQVTVKPGCFEKRWSLFDGMATKAEREAKIAEFITLQQANGVEAGEVPRSVAVVGSQETGYALVLLIHHSLYDKVALDLLMQDLLTACQVISKDEATISSLAASPSMGSYVAFCHEKSSDQLDAARSIYLEKCQPALWPSGKPLLQVCKVTLNLSVSFDTILARHGATRVGIARAALSSALLAMQSAASSSLTYAEVISGRHQDGFASLEEMRGPAAVVQPVSVNFLPEASAFMAACSDDYLKRLDLASSASHSRKEISVTSLCRVLVSFDDCSTQSLMDTAEPHFLPLQLSSSDTSKTGFAIAVACQVNVDEIVMHFELDDDSAEEQLEELLKRMKAFCDRLAGQRGSGMEYEQKITQVEAGEKSLEKSILPNEETVVKKPPTAGIPSAAQVRLEQRFGEFVANIVDPESSYSDYDVNCALDSFGLDSIGVMRLVAMARKKGHKVRTAAISKKSTIRSLISALLAEGGGDQQDHSEWAAVHCLQQATRVKGQSEWLVAVHDFAGIATVYEPLMKLILARRPDLGVLLISDANAGLEAPSTITLHDLATKYLDAVKANVDRGAKVNVLGWSFGGVVSFEMVRLMEQEQDQLQPCQLFLLDSYMHSRDDFGTASEPNSMPEIAQRNRSLAVQWYKAVDYFKSYCKPQQLIVTSTLLIQATQDEAATPLTREKESFLTWNGLLPTHSTKSLPLPTSHFKLLDDSQLPSICDAICQSLSSS